MNKLIFDRVEVCKFAVNLGKVDVSKIVVSN